MARIVWMAGGVLGLALVASPWLSTPGASPATPPETREAPAEPAPPVKSAPVAARRAALPERMMTAPFLATPTPVPAGEEPPDVRPWRVARRGLSEPRRRVVSALRADYTTPLARRDAVLAALRHSGEAEAAWSPGARTALATWRTTLEAQVLPVRAEPPRCYAAGCLTHVTFPDAASYEAARQLVPGLSLPGAVAHLQLPAETLASGEVRVVWAVLPPERP